MSLLIKGVTKLSELDIDANKDWGAYGISNIGTVVVTDGADHYFELPSLTTVQRDALAPSTGMQIWNSTEGQIEKYNGATWGSVGIAGVTVRKDSGSDIGTRPRLNLIQGAGMLNAVADDPTDDEIDFTITSKYSHWNELLLPEDASLPVANPAALATVDGANFAYKVLDFDHTVEESVNWQKYLTLDYLSENLVVDIYWESLGAGDAKFGFKVLGKEPGETWDDTLGSEYYILQTNAGAGKLNRARIISMPTQWEPGDSLIFKLARKAADVEDTINANDVRVVKVVLGFTLGFGQSFYNLATYVNVSPVAIGWQDVDCSAYIPEGATGVILHVINKHLTTARDIGLRKKGSSDDFHTWHLDDECHMWAAIGVDENREFQAYLENLVNQEVWLVGYTTAGVTFLTNAVEKTGVTLDTWVTQDCPTECPNAIGLIIEVLCQDGYNIGLRKYGSSDDRHQTLRNHCWAIIGCDGNQRFQTWRSHVNNEFYVVGYVTQGAIFKLNADDKSLAGIGAYQDVDCSVEAPGAVMLFFEINGWPLEDMYALRRKGSAEDIYYVDSGEAFAFVECDANSRVEGKIESVTVDFFLMGYATAVL